MANVNDQELLNNKGEDKHNAKTRQRYQGSRAGKSGRSGNRSNCKDGQRMKQDWRWYAITEQIAKDLGSFPYSIIPGVGTNVDVVAYSRQDSGPVAQPISNSWRDPSCLKLLYIPSYGVATQKTDGINMAASQFFKYVRGKNSGAANYEAPDLMMFVLAMAEIYRQYLEMRRDLGLVAEFDIVNHNMPDIFLRAIGYSEAGIADLSANHANYRGRLNILASKINAIAVPKYFSIFERIDFVSSNVFMDSDSIRGQFYLYVAKGYYKWSSTTSNQGSELVYTEQNFATFADRLKNLEDMINALFLDTDINIMSGDIEKKFDAPERYALVETDEFYSVHPVMQTDALAQIENSFAAETFTGINGTLLSTSSLNITQDVNLQIIKWQPILDEAGEGYFTFNPSFYLFNSHDDNVDYTKNLDWSRLICTGNTTLSQVGVLSTTITSCGSELIWNYSIYRYNAQGSIVFDKFTNGSFNEPNAANNEIDVGILASLIDAFDWHPTMYFLDSGELHVFADIKKSTWIAKQTVTSINQEANTAVLWGGDKYKATNQQ